jgi:hypothetical protein
MGAGFSNAFLMRSTLTAGFSAGGEACAAIPTGSAAMTIAAAMTRRRTSFRR